MASSLFALLDDIATVLDDVATMTKVAAKKTAGVLSDDLAVNAEQVSGVRANRELPVIWAVFKGSALNKTILVPAALVLSAFAPWAITPVLMLGGAFLCFEGMEKVVSKWLHPKEEAAAEQALHDAVLDPSVDLMELEKQKIKGAIRTDFILSAEIIVITLGTVANVGFGTRVGVLVSIATLMTVGVYGLVAGIVKMDDLGLALTQRPRAISQSIGRGLLAFAPKFMKFLSVAGTIAMFLVGGGIIAHGIPTLHHWQLWIEEAVGGGAVGTICGVLYTGVVGMVLGVVLVMLFELFTNLYRKSITKTDS